MATNFTTSVNMSMQIPVVGSEAGPEYAIDINECLTTIDSHDHSSGSGVQITPAGMNINADLEFSNNNILAPRSVRFQSQASALVEALDKLCLYAGVSANGDLFFIDGQGNDIQITSGGSIAGTPGNITGLIAPAAVLWLNPTQTFQFTQDEGNDTPAALDAGTIKVRNMSPAAFGITIEAPTLGSDETLILPNTPSQASYTMVDETGEMSTLPRGIVNAIGSKGAIDSPVAVNWSASPAQSITLTGNVTLTFSGALNGESYMLLVTNSGAARTITWPASVRWSFSVVPTPSGSGKVDIYNFFFDGTDYFGAASMSY